MLRKNTKTVATESAPAGLRERGKKERLRRLKEAAFEVFRVEGYEGANTRTIAERADISIGTLYVYAKDKRDLLFLVLNEDLDSIAKKATAILPQKGSVADRIVTLLSPIYSYFAAEPELARTTVYEGTRLDLHVEMGAQAERFYARMQRWQSEITRILIEAEKRGELKIGDDAALLGRAIFTAHLGEVRRWLQNDNPQAETGVRELARLVRVIIGDRR